MSNQKPNLGYIGLGMMGGPMALRLANADFPLSIWGRSPAKLEAAKAAGARAVETAAQVARDADIVFTCL
ncbi:MAG: NAD(P)-binding domain-containing protein, partial [Alphaproteobacteria bacterium]|nr:NAD(P)-binding domain-containing protein [Alphaproteobacteria bacterium]